MVEGLGWLNKWAGADLTVRNRLQNNYHGKHLRDILVRVLRLVHDA